MKLFYQSMGVARRSQTGPYATALSRILAGAAAPGTGITVQGLAPGRAIADQYRYLELLDTPEILDNGLRAEAQGFDAFLIGNVFEPGLHALRELLNIPVLGLCESSVHLACLMGASFSIVNVNPKFRRRVTENVTATGLVGRMVSIDDMQVERGAVLDRAFEDAAVRDVVVAQFSEAARRGIAKGAETVIPAGGIVMTILAHAGVHKVDDVPIVNGLIALVKTAEMAVQIRQLTGGFTSKRMMYAPPSGPLLADIRAAYGAHVYPGAV
ncbi:MAG: aspartate/glutamate racemase family protein [Acetobacteraceae bacterium]